LYSNSVLALDPATGDLEWYYQFVPGETHDLDEVFESVLIDHDGRRSLFKMGKLEMSQLCAEKAKTLAKGDSGIYNNIGVTFLVMGDKQAAISEFKTATKLDPANVPANLNLGYLAIDSGDYELGFKSFSAVASSEPGNIAGKLGLAVSLRGKKDFEAAGKLYDEVIAADPKNEAAYFNAATLHRKYTKNFKKASKYLDAYVAAFQGQIDPGHPVFERKALVQKAIDAETAKKAEANRRKQEAEERKKRQRKVFEDLKVKVASLDALLTKYGSCELMIEMGGIDMGQMVLEQAQMVVEAEEIDMAADVMTFMDDLLPQLQSNTAFCDDEFSAKAVGVWE
jgi:Tfp pilus assembly protein PilF